MAQLRPYFLIDESARPAAAAAGFLRPALGGRVGKDVTGDEAAALPRQFATRMRHGAPPRKDGARQPCGKLRPVPMAEEPPAGIAERRVLALELAGAPLQPMASYALGLARLRKLCSEAEYLAALKFARDAFVLFPTKTPPACLGNLLPAGEATIALPKSDSFAAKAEVRYAKAEALRREDAGAWRELVNLVLYDHPPRWLDTARARPQSAWAADERGLAQFRHAAQHLAVIYGCEEDADDTVLSLKRSVAAFLRHQAERLEAEAREADKAARPEKKRRAPAARAAK